MMLSQWLLLAAGRGEGGGLGLELVSEDVYPPYGRWLCAGGGVHEGVARGREIYRYRYIPVYTWRLNQG